MRRYQVYVGAWLLGSVLGAAAWGAGKAPTLAPQIKAYAEQWHFPTRTVTVDRVTEEVDRVFVPVTQESVRDFTERFSTKNGAIIWRSMNDLIHVFINLAPGQAIAHEMRFDPFEEKHLHSFWGRTLNPQGGGRFLTLSLPPEQMAGLTEFWNQYGGWHDNEAQWQAAHLGQARYGGCMWWLVHAEAGPGLSLAHVMGVKRSKGPESLYPKLLYSGNQNVGPVGVPVDPAVKQYPHSVGFQTVEQFLGASDLQLMGAPPQGGEIENIKGL